MMISKKPQDSHGNMGLSINGNERLPYQIMTEHKIMKIASGADHIVFLTNLGEVFTCGCAEQGQLGRTSKRSSDRESRYGIGKGNIGRVFVFLWSINVGVLSEVNL